MHSRFIGPMVLAWLGLAAGAQAVTFGEQGTGTASTPGLNLSYATQYSCPATGTVNYLALYVSIASGQGNVAIYADSGSNTPGALMVQGTPATLVAGPNFFPIPETGVTQNVTYWLAFITSDASARIDYVTGDPILIKPNAQAAAWTTGNFDSNFLYDGSYSRTAFAFMPLKLHPRPRPPFRTRRPLRRRTPIHRPLRARRP